MLMDEVLPGSARRTPLSTVPPMLLLIRYLESPWAARRALSDRVVVAGWTLVADGVGAGGGGAGGGGMSGILGLLKHIVCLLLLSELLCEEADNCSLPSFDPDQSIWIAQGWALVREQLVKRNH